MTAGTPLSIRFNLLTSESQSLAHMLERSGLGDGLSLTNNALSWYKSYRDAKASGLYMIARKEDSGCYYFINDDARAGDKAQKQFLLLTKAGIAKIRENFSDCCKTDNDVPAVLSDAFYILDQVITAQKKGLLISILNGKTQTYEELMNRLMQP